MACCEDNERYLQSLEGFQEWLFEIIVRTQTPKQPYVMNHIIEALMEDPEENEICELTDEDTGRGICFLAFNHRVCKKFGLWIAPES
jgi:hypothetical protein